MSIRQPACCELWPWLVWLDWFSDSTCCHLLTQMLRTWFGLPELDNPNFWSPRFVCVLIGFPIRFLISGLSLMQAVKFSANTSIFLTRISCILIHKTHTSGYHKHPPNSCYCLVLLTYPNFQQTLNTNLPWWPCCLSYIRKKSKILSRLSRLMLRFSFIVPF